MTQTSEYKPYGQLLNRTLTDGSGFTGRVQDVLTGLTYMQQRYYDQGIGRFLSTDPVTAYSSPGANFNRYWYANNNPYRFTDPDGRQSAADSSGDQFKRDAEAGNLKVYKSFEKPAIVITAVMAAPVVAAVGWEAGMAVLANPGAVAAATDIAAGAAGVTGTVGVAALAGKEAGAAKKFFSGAKYTDKVLGQMKQGDFHAFPESVKAFQGAGQVTKVTGGDGVAREMLAIPGGYKGKEGAFEFIKDANGSISHRLFNPNKVHDSWLLQFGLIRLIQF